MSAIEWTERTWNPVTGCSKVSPGCAHCYAESLTLRFAGAWGVPRLPWTPANAAENVILHPERLAQPASWRPSVVFVNSMSDLFHELVPDSFIRRVFYTMGACQEHTFQVLTKRPERMREFMEQRYPETVALDELDGAVVVVPLPNVWLGTSIENRRFVGRADALRATPAAVRFVSAEPLLGPLDGLDLDGIDWLIVGGESGAGARPLHVGWVRDLIGACRESGAAPFVKQLGSRWARANGLRGKGGDPAEWPDGLAVREMPAGAAVPS